MLAMEFKELSSQILNRACVFLSFLGSLKTLRFLQLIVMITDGMLVGKGVKMENKSKIAFEV